MQRRRKVLAACGPEHSLSNQSYHEGIEAATAHLCHRHLGEQGQRDTAPGVGLSRCHCTQSMVVCYLLRYDRAKCATVLCSKSVEFYFN